MLEYPREEVRARRLRLTRRGEYVMWLLHASLCPRAEVLAHSAPSDCRVLRRPLAGDRTPRAQLVRGAQDAKGVDRGSRSAARPDHHHRGQHGTRLQLGCQGTPQAEGGRRELKHNGLGCLCHCVAAERGRAGVTWRKESTHILRGVEDKKRRERSFYHRALVTSGKCWVEACLEAEGSVGGGAHSGFRLHGDHSLQLLSGFGAAPRHPPRGTSRALLLAWPI